MRATIRFLTALLAGLGVLTLVGYLAVIRTTRRWFEHDLALRSRLAVLAAQQSLKTGWHGDRAGLTATLADITRDERIMGAAACADDGAQLAATEGYPIEFPCRFVTEQMRAEGSSARGRPASSCRPGR